MNFSKKTFLLLLFVLVLLFPDLFGATRVIDKSAAAGTLKARWDQTLATGLRQGKSFWLGYSVDRSMAENRFFISNSRMFGSITVSSISSDCEWLKGEPLGKLIYGKDAKIVLPKLKNDKERIKAAAKAAIAHMNDRRKKRLYKKVNKEVAILFLFEPGKGKEPSKIGHSNMEVPFESDGNPIYWLGKTDETSSFGLAKGLFARAGGEKAKRRIISVIGYHPIPGQVIPFLAKVVNSDETDKVRARAANELGDQNDVSAVKVLLNIAHKDHSVEVRRKAVNALEDLEFPQSVDALIDIAKKANNAYVRKKAINTLADVGTKKAGEALYDIALNDTSIEIQRKAVNAFEDLPNNEGVDYLIKIAKSHPRPYIRKKAVNCLSDIKDPRAFKAIMDIAKQK